MADKNLSTNIPAADPLDGTELMYVVQGGNSRKTNVKDVANKATLVIEEELGTTYTAVAGDNRKWKEMNNAAAITVTIDASVHAAGDELTFEQKGAGAITFAAGAGFTLNSRGSLLSTSGQHAVASIKLKSATEGVLFGDLA